MAISFLRMTVLAASAMALATSVAAAETDETSGPLIRTNTSGVMITQSIRNGSLESLRNIVVRPADFQKAPRELPIDRIPGPGHGHASASHATAADALSGERVMQREVHAAGALAVTQGSNVLGVGQGFVGPSGKFIVQFAPPDTDGAVGDLQYVQVVNTGLAVFDKSTKAVLFGPVPTSSLWQGFGGPCESDDDGDGTVVYDKVAKRWIISQFAVDQTPMMQCVAVSKTSDATGGWWLYAFTPTGTDFPDYPKLGVWPDGYYETFNMFGGNNFDGAQLCAYDRAKMLTGAPASQQCFQLASDFGGVLPSDLDGAMAPPAGSPNYLMDLDATGSGPSSDTLNLWKFHVDWTHPGNTTLSAPTKIPVASYIGACNWSNTDCIKQKSAPVNGLDALGDRMMFRLAYRNFGTHESLVAVHSIDLGTNNRNASTGVRWYEIRSPGTTPVVYQQSTFAPDATYRWMPSIAMDKQGDIAIGYSGSGTTSNPSVRYAARLASDPLSTMNSEIVVHTGAGAERIGLARWGDYSAMTVDPSDDCTFWYTNEYEPANGDFNWATRIGSFKFPTCN